jgi:hypothetical protein
MHEIKNGTSEDGRGGLERCRHETSVVPWSKRLSHEETVFRESAEHFKSESPFIMLNLENTVHDIFEIS